jgi:hypothetical protein
MDSTRNTESNERPRETVVSRIPQNTDLPDSPHDAERLKSDETTLDLPDVEDIPGQEHVQAPQLGELADTTASSADEEGDDVFNSTAGSETTQSDES